MRPQASRTGGSALCRTTWFVPLARYATYLASTGKTPPPLRASPDPLYLLRHLRSPPTPSRTRTSFCTRMPICGSGPRRAGHRLPCYSRVRAPCDRHHCLKLELHTHGLGAIVWQRSYADLRLKLWTSRPALNLLLTRPGPILCRTELCRAAYKQPVFNAEDHITLLRSHGQRVQLSSSQQNVHRALFVWRDQVAREEDESVNYVLPPPNLLQLAQASPTTREALLAACPSLYAPMVLKSGSAE